MSVEGLGGGNRGVAFLVSAGITYEIIAAACSSPQTTEINAATRADTLMKWVYIGLGQAGLFVVAAAVFGRELAGPILAGGMLAAILLYVQYAHARKAGLEAACDGAPGTEQ